MNMPKSKTFSEILAEALGERHTEKNTKGKLTEQIIDEEIQGINKVIKTFGDVVMGNTHILECHCGSSAKIEVEFTALKFTADGIEVTEGKIEKIIRVK